MMKIAKIRNFIRLEKDPEGKQVLTGEMKTIGTSEKVTKIIVKKSIIYWVDKFDCSHTLELTDNDSFVIEGDE